MLLGKPKGPRNAGRRDEKNFDHLFGGRNAGPVTNKTPFEFDRCRAFGVSQIVIKSARGEQLLAAVAAGGPSTAVMRTLVSGARSPTQRWGAFGFR
jgi:hypothetical protein